MAEFNFALPRIVARLFGQEAPPTETNWWEANVVGTLNHFVVYAFSFELLVGRFALWLQLLLLLPLLLVAWVFWLILFYVNSRIIALARNYEILRGIQNHRAQSVLIALVTTCIGLYLMQSETWTAVVGCIWIVAVGLNLTAAALLAVLPTNDPTHG